MKTQSRAILKIVEEQCKKWQISRVEKKKECEIPIITVSREPGSGGQLVAERIAEIMNLELFHQEVIHKMAESANVSARLLETLDEKGLNILEDWVASLNKQHLWPDQYIKHLAKVVNTIEKHCRAVIVGRGCGFILPPETRFRVRIVAPLETRIKRVAQAFDVSWDDAKKRIIRSESDRRAFIRKYFYTNISDPKNYDLIVNTDTLSIDEAAKTVKSTIEIKYGVSSSPKLALAS